jgi:hypothetical protein
MNEKNIRNKIDMEKRLLLKLGLKNDAYHNAATSIQSLIFFKKKE